jgi:hypothetical protein
MAIVRTSRWIWVPVTVLVALCVWLLLRSQESASPEIDDTSAPVPAPPAPAHQKAAPLGRDPWAMVAEASRQADAMQTSERTDCSLPPVIDPRLSDTERERLEQQQLHDRLQSLAHVLSAAPDELGRLTGAVLKEDLGAVVRLAHATRDPVIYGLALRVCGSRPAGSACQSLQPERWTQLDPSNASAWWAVAARSADAASTLAAAQRAAQSPQVLVLDGRLLQRATEVPDFPPDLALPVLAATFTVSPYSSAFALTRVCGREAPLQGDTAAPCRQLALKALRQEPSVQGRILLTQRAQQWGLPPQQLPATVDSLKQLRNDIEVWRLSGMNDPAVRCDDVKRLVAFDIDAMNGGDVAAYQRIQERKQQQAQAATVPSTLQPLATNASASAAAPTP